MTTPKYCIKIYSLFLCCISTAFSQINVESLGQYQGGATSKGLPSFAFHENYAYALFTATNNMGKIMRYNLATGATDLSGDLFPTIAENDTSHNGSAIAIDGDGYIHVWIGMHNDAMKYYRSLTPGSYNSFSGNLGNTMNYNGSVAEAFTYPSACTSSNGDVFLIIRNDGPNSQQNETQWFFHWDNSTDTWTATKVFAKQDYNAYLSQVYADESNSVHMVTAWSKYHDGPNTFQKGTYMRYDVDEKKYYKADNTEVTSALPIAHDAAEADPFYTNQLPWATDPDDDDTEEIQVPRVSLNRNGYPTVSYSQSQDNGVGEIWNAQIDTWNGTAWVRTENIIENVNEFARTDITYTGGRLNLFERISGKIHIISSEDNGATFLPPVAAIGGKIPSDAKRFDACTDLYLDHRGLYRVTYSSTETPSISLISPQENAVFKVSETISLTPSIQNSKGDIAQVEYYDNNTLLYTSTEAPFQYEWKKARSVGNHTIKAIAYSDFCSNQDTEITIQVITDGSSESTNVALNNLANKSGEQLNNEAENLVDDNLENRWSSQFFPQWVELDFGENKTITHSELTTHLGRAYQYTIQSKAEGESYKLLVDRSNNTTGSTIDTPIVDDFIDTTARFVRLEVTGAHEYTGSWVSLSEFKIYGTSTLATNNTNSTPLNFTITPNPVNAYLNIKLNNVANTSKAKLSIYNTLGKLIQSSTFLQPRDPLIVAVDQLIPGIYLAVLEHKNGTSQITFIKN